MTLQTPGTPETADAPPAEAGTPCRTSRRARENLLSNSRSVNRSSVTSPHLSAGHAGWKAGLATYFVLSLLFASSTPAAESPEIAAARDPATRYSKPDRPSRDGIDKVYFGRQIAHVMGHQAAEWLERPERDDEEKTELLVTLLKLKPGEAAADIGAGTGYFTRRMAKQVGTNGTVYAVEIQQEMLDILTNKMAEIGIRNVKPVLGTITDPKLPANSLDLILMVDVYHEFDHPYEMVEAMSKALKPGGRMVFVEYRAEDPTVPIKLLHKMSEAQVKREIQPHPLVWSETLKDLPRQHVIVFKRKP